MPETAYLRTPSIRGDTIVLATEDDLWTVPRTGGVARRLTSNLGPVGRASLSPDGAWIALTGTEEAHPEVYVMASDGGPARRLTYLGANSAVRGWAPDGRIVFMTDAGQPFAGDYHIWTIDPEAALGTRLPFGPATEASYARDGAGVVLGRHTTDPARWKRYRGGTRGDVWIARRGDGQFQRLLNLEGNLASPMWVGDRIYFLSDHEGIGNLYSCRPTGGDVRRHTDHAEYYARWAQTDGVRVVYQHAGEIWCHDPAGDTSERVEVDVRSPRIGRNRRFVDAARYMHTWSVHPEGHSIATESRGKLHTMPLWEESARQFGRRDGVRYRLTHWTADGGALVTVSDEGGEEAIEVYDAEDGTLRTRLAEIDVGRPVELVTSPVGNQVVLSNHRMELIWVDLDSGESRVVDRSEHQRITGLAWSPDGRYVAYAFETTPWTSIIRIATPADGTVRDVTRPDFHDLRPSFDPEGRYLYFLSYRVFDPVYDSLYFSIGFPRTVRPHLVTLRADEPSPFVPKPKGFGEPKKDKAGDDAAKDQKTKQAAKAKDTPKPTEIDFDGIADRVVAFPVPEGRYAQVWGIPGKVLFTNFPILGSIGSNWFEDDEEPRGKLEVYDLKELKHDTLVQGINHFKVSPDGHTLIYQAKRKLRALKAGEKPNDKDGDQPSRKTGWIDLSRIRISVSPPAEWRQMYREAWRFQREHFWVPDMSGVDWQRIHDRYLPLLDKVTTRIEFSDLMWEMIGELGTSHAYEIGGDIKPAPPWPVGHLGCDLELDDRSGRWRIVHIVRGDTWDPDGDSPLRAPGAQVKEGDTILAVNGQPVGREVAPAELLVHQAGMNVELTVGDARGRNARRVIVRTLRQDKPARYREWVERNRALVHEATEGRAGYIHVPNMGPTGYAEFHRYYRAELDREALIVDVRHNGGGHVSQLLIEKLARERIGFDAQRWGTPEPYPSDSPAGPLVCLTDENAGSDGDIFTHVFKLKGLGPVVGKRTWGGVVGITLRHQLVDNGVTTQPEFAFWFKDVGWGVENYGTDPDHDVDIKPQDHAEGRDPQMDKGLELVQRALRRHKPLRPDLGTRPTRALPTLPDRTSDVVGRRPKAPKRKAR